MGEDEFRERPPLNTKVAPVWLHVWICISSVPIRASARQLCVRESDYEEVAGNWS